jgi:hypothetical protein
MLLNQLHFIITKSLFIAVFLHAYENSLHDSSFAYEESYEDRFNPEESDYSIGFVCLKRKIKHSCFTMMECANPCTFENLLPSV